MLANIDESACDGLPPPQILPGLEHPRQPVRMRKGKGMTGAAGARLNLYTMCGLGAIPSEVPGWENKLKSCDVLLRPAQKDGPVYGNGYERVKLDATPYRN